jgi:hypothetical protein
MRGRANRSRVAVPLMFFMSALSGCTAHTSRDAASKADVDDSEILIRHLLKRVSELNTLVDEHDNKCLQQQLDELKRSEALHSRNYEFEAAKARALARAHHDEAEMQETFERLAQYLLDSEAATEQHNRKHPESPWADSKAVLRSVCGDCVRERYSRESQLRSEAQK